MQKFSLKDVKIIAKEVVREGFLSIYQYQVQHRLFAGGWSPTFTREIMDRGHAVVVLPYDPKLDALVVLEQFRIGALEDPHSPWLIEFVAGMMDQEDEQPEEVAHRELMEEAGLTTDVLHHAITYWSTPGGCTEQITVYVAEVDSSQASRHGGLASEHEDIRVHVLPFTDVVSLLEQGKINNAASVIGLQWMQLHKRKFEQI
ncbi:MULTISPECIES: NUDIX domain-containing protein [Pseudidiomarina]|uniref:ADP-ribose pyrophosphatase n=3 Tax=Pseudidiomarina TaxID=2800384 RepID=A0A368UQ34_9GAMM|nr:MULTISPECIES: NUDIX domain-containing protein [Pseudidiomarina]MDX1526529.1 NUDIX domain-containing protein [Pseudidiomarina maritima]PWW10587.1 ADP-ribose pyrophosphatase [Pseudidiomarina maritima]RBP88335.1 ADP-ribose pyrophosphatase [Pseudidiomarina tainanensis]RCW30265.1 ADP-ribose pyrophosphatase [Pseudidiomarina tainanensis]